MKASILRNSSGIGSVRIRCNSLFSRFRVAAERFQPESVRIPVSSHASLSWSCRHFTSSSSSSSSALNGISDDILHCLQNNKSEDAAKLMSKRYQETKEDGLTPALQFLQKSPHQSEELLKYLQVMDVAFYPKMDHYKFVLNGWRNFRPPSAKRAQAFLISTQVPSTILQDSVS